MRSILSRSLSTFAKMTEGLKQNRGAFILFEGIDRCGKTTQSKKISSFCVDTLGKNTELIRFPDRESSIGHLINSYLQSTSNLNDQAIHLLFSANRWESSTGLEAKLNSGCNLVLIFPIFSLGDSLMWG
jgi:dTMP kinase